MKLYQFILSDWLIETKLIPHCGMEGLKYFIITPGALCVMTHGVLKMLMLYVDSWDTLVQSRPFVSSNYHVYNEWITSVLQY